MTTIDQKGGRVARDRRFPSEHFSCRQSIPAAKTLGGNVVGRAVVGVSGAVAGTVGRVPRVSRGTEGLAARVSCAAEGGAVQLAAALRGELVRLCPP